MKTLAITLAVVFAVSAGIAAQAQQPKKRQYGILLDNTGSMRNQFDTVKAIAKVIIQRTSACGPVSIVDFGSATRGPGSKALPIARIESSQDKKLLDSVVENLYVEGGQTTLLDAVDFFAQHLNDTGVDSDGYVVLITDGEDRASNITKKTLVEKLKLHNIRVYAVGLVQQLDPKPRERATDLLKSITTETGGRVVFPDSGKVNLEDLLIEIASPVK
jgi:uncharacterized protein with von Willebrand factor type A (vWA) domain